MEEMGLLEVCTDLINETATFLNCTLDADTLRIDRENCSGMVSQKLCENNIVCDSSPDLIKFFTIVAVIVFSLIGNTCTILILSRFKIHKVPDVLVMGLAITDLLTGLVPIPMSAYAYYNGINFTEGCVLCDFFGTLAHFTRFSSAQIVTIVALERYFAVNRPFIYRKYATPRLFVIILLVSWLIAFLLGAVPLMVEDLVIATHDGFCLFDIYNRYYAIVILVYASTQFVTVFLCFLLVTLELIKVYRRRKRLKVQGEYNKSSRARHRDPAELTFTRPNLTSRISDLGKSIKKAAPIITEKFQLSVEAQFARMLFAVVGLYYISWTTIVLVVLVAQIKGSSSELETALFWGIRLAIISTAINPFLYGILARQYRLAYYYVVRLWLSKCCSCVSPPLKDVFASARNAGGEIQEGNRRGSQSRYGTQRSVGSQSGKSAHVYTKTGGNVLLTGTTHITLPPSLNKIQEELSLDVNESSIAAEFSTHVPTAGELSSSVTIPYQARDHNDSSTVDLQVRGAASMHDLVDAGLVELGNSRNPQAGVENPLAMITKVVGGEEVLVSPVGSELDSESTRVESPPLFSNPMYELATGISKKSGEDLEAELNHRQTMLAASSTDDITLISKKKKVTKTRSSDVPYTSAHQERSSRHSKGVTLAHSGYVVLQHEKLSNGLEKTSKKRMLKATDIDTGLPVAVSTSRENLDQGNHPPPQMKNIQMHAHSRSFDAASTHPEAGSKVSQRNSYNMELSSRTPEVSKLKEQFESGLVTSTPPVGQSNRAGSQSHSHTTRIVHRNSTENSDSGHESMLETDPVPVLH